MKKITYNLAAARRIDGRSFAFRAAILVLSILLFAGVAIFNLVRQHEKNRVEKSKAGQLGQRIDEMRRQSDRQSQELTAWKNNWKADLDTANALIERKIFSFAARLDFLERISSPGIRIRQLSLVNGAAGQVGMIITSRSLKELFALYKKLAPYELVIASETQIQDETQVSLNFNIPNEKL